jgi:uncharacterized protein
MKKFKKSYYNFIKEYNGNTVIYNTKTGSVSIISPESSNDFLSIIENPNAENVNDKLFQQMLSEGYIVDEQFDELNDIRELSNTSRSFSNVLRVTVLPTETCNFTCPYCFIYTMRNKHMTDETWKALYKMFYNFCEKNKDSEVFFLNILWYGGEPLIMADKIISFMQKINKLLERYPNGRLHSSIVTNGYLLTYKIFQELCDANVRQIQVTLDGDAENHDKYRTLSNKRPTFHTIYSNLLEIKDKVAKDEKFSFAIRCNFLKSSIPSARRLIELFSKDFLSDGRFNLYFRPVYDFETDRNSDDINESDYFGITAGSEMQNQLLLETNQDIKQVAGISNPLPEPIPSWCESVAEHAFIIGYDGSIYICDTMITDTDKAVGYLKMDGTIELNSKADCWRKTIFERDGENDSDASKECMVCKMLPICMGGCVRSRMDSGKNTCFWDEDLIYKAMDDYAKVYGE